MAIGLGSNLGIREERLQFALLRLGEFLDELRVSSLYETEPVHDVEQPRFLNAACTGATRLTPRQLLSQLQDTERAAGRRRGVRRFGPRTLDLDLLLYGDEIVRQPDLIVPHPRLQERAFVLVPLAEIAGEWIVPDGSSRPASVAELLSRVDTSGVYPLGYGLELSFREQPGEETD
ncbi:MAG: 2-amino-4-hydroxy-6-hydroxymethyldihydropteridine diphosphokinase [marine benthic group bacterium]|nr:2-amino-4-hydroxy-6-hydroxymethyldihydropteridine diphosphokinase [Candidatus Carthagonibacter metallireducens]